ncbi:hypothetical protein COSO111634_25480 [Corallococcus soli]
MLSSPLRAAVRSARTTTHEPTGKLATLATWTRVAWLGASCVSATDAVAADVQDTVDSRGPTRMTRLKRMSVAAL